ncbi:hypothetical protein PINS_up002140 [Pythium insidiosum]|nr:hypothetical protein PINS_up002140 [Pythium insidiosum]
MPSLKVLYLQGNDVVKHIKQYRKTLVYRCRQLKYLDDRPVFDDERRRVDAWGKALDASNGDYKAAQEAEREEMDKIRQEKRDRDRQNFLHFEQLIADGRRKLELEKQAAAAGAITAESTVDNQQSPSKDGPEINPFSGERIIPTQDCELLQKQREKRWEKIVNSPDAWTARETEHPPKPASDGSIPVDHKRLQLLHQCATIGSGSVSSTDPFVESTFQVVTPPPAPISSAPVDLEHRQRIKKQAEDKVQELKLKKKALAELDASLQHPATTIINCVQHVTLHDDVPIPAPHCNQEATLPPPAPSVVRPTSASALTNVDELD